MQLNHVIIAAVLSFTSLSSHAGIIYEWKPVKKEAPSWFGMRIEFDEATVASGSFSFSVGPGDPQPQLGSGLIAFCTPYSCYRPQSDPFNHGMGFGYLNMSVNFVEGKFLAGSIQYHDWQSTLNLATGLNGSDNDRLFTIYDTNADYGMGDCGGPTGITCSGGTGHLRQVPEPAPIALLGLGALVAVGARRRQRKAAIAPRAATAG